MGNPDQIATEALDTAIELSPVNIISNSLSQSQFLLKIIFELRKDIEHYKTRCQCGPFVCVPAILRRVTVPYYSSSTESSPQAQRHKVFDLSFSLQHVVE